MTKAKLITVEGIEGVGKSTHSEAIHRHLKLRNIDSIVTREPGGTPLGEKIRSLLLADTGDSMHADTELLLMFAARAEHLQRVILPALGDGKWVVCDRFTDATYAYQGGGRGIPDERIAVMEAWVQRALRPDLTLLLDMDPSQALRRTRHRGNKDRFEHETPAFFGRVRDQYLRMAAEQAARYRIIDASAPVEAVEHAIGMVIDAFIGYNH